MYRVLPTMPSWARLDFTIFNVLHRSAIRAANPLLIEKPTFDKSQPPPWHYFSHRALHRAYHVSFSAGLSLKEFAPDVRLVPIVNTH